MSHENATKSSLLRVMRALLEGSRMYTAERLRASITPHTESTATIRRHLNAIHEAGFLIDKDDRHRYYFSESKPYKKLNG